MNQRLRSAVAANAQMAETLPIQRFPNVLLGALALILILCGFLGAGAYLYASATHLISEYRRHLNAAADRAQLYFDQREILLRALAATAVHPSEISLSPRVKNLRPLDTPETKKNERRSLLLTHRHWAALLRTGTLSYIQPDPVRAYRLEQIGNRLHWQSQDNDLAVRLGTINTAPQARRTPVVWLRQAGNAQPRLVAYTPIDRDDKEGGWLGLELKDIDAALTSNRLPPNTEYILFDIHDQAVLFSNAPPAPSKLYLLKGDYFGFSDEWLPQRIILSKSIGSGGLRVLYATPTGQLLLDGRFILTNALLALAAFTGAVLLGARLVRQHLLIPANLQAQNLFDSMSLNRKLVAMAPVGLALIDSKGELIFQRNTQAQAWMDGDKQWRTRLPQKEADSTRSDVTLENGRIVRIHTITLNYRSHHAALCSIMDVTAEKAEETALRLARQQAENANTAKTQFLTTMSHEIRTPLYGILGTLELMLLSDTQHRQTSYLDTLRRSAETLYRVVGESLDLSRIEAGHIILEAQEFSPQAQIDDVLSAYAATAQNKGLLLYAITPVRALDTAIGDPLRIGQILSNLVSNAIKFTLSGHVAIRLHIDPQPDNQLTLRFQVADSGRGISAEAMPKLFMPYFSQNIGTNEQSGTGLGLPICQQLANLMGGSLSVVSEPGLGTSISFEIKLPLASPGAPPPPTPHKLSFQPVYVTGDVPEIIMNVCSWLRYLGADAQPYTNQPAQTGAVLVQTWPSLATPRPKWFGYQVIVLPNAQPEIRHIEQPDRLYSASNAITHIAQAVQQAQTLDVTYDPSSLPPAPTLHGPNVLLVDDNQLNRQIRQEQLNILGCFIQIEVNAESALMLANTERVDIILIDLDMTTTNGYTLASALRAQSYQGRIIGITATAPLNSDRKWAAAGIDDLLIKPVSIATLRTSLLNQPC